MKRKYMKEQGGALIFALIIIGLLLILTVIFITTSIQAKRSSVNAANMTIARTLAKSTVTRVLGMLEAYDGGNLHSASPAKITDMLENLSTKDIFIWNSILHKKISWELVRSHDLNNNRILGRVAYVVSPGSGIDPAACVAPGQNEGIYPEKRIGASMTDINLRSLDPSLIDRELGLKLSYNDVPGGRLPIAKKLPGLWHNFATLASRVAPINADQKTRMKQYFLIDPPQDRELFWLDINNDKITNPDSELFNRFNLHKSQRDWDNMTLNSLLSAAELQHAENPNAGGVPWLKYLGKLWNGEKFIDDESVKGTFRDIATRRLQIVANLKDYCDSDTEPSSDVVPSDWDNIQKSGPTYTGNERVPILNEIGCYIKITPKKDDHNVWVTTSGSMAAELINLYGVSFNKTTNVIIYGTYQFSIQFKQQQDKNWQSITQNGQFTQKINLANDRLAWSADDATAIYNPTGADNKQAEITIAANGYKMSWSDGAGKFIPQNQTKFKIDPQKGYSSIRLSDAKLTIARAVLQYDGKNVDLMLADRTPPLNDAGLVFNWQRLLISEQQPKSWETAYMVACAVTIDPRQNLNPGDWLTKASTISGVDNSKGTPENINKIYRQAGGSVAMPNCVGYWSQTDKARLSPYGSYSANPGSVDYEKNIYNPVNISTNMIRNASIKSPWELGFIHRGAAWQTINLAKFDEAHAISYRDGSTVGKYRNGDGNILDQIKMNANLTNPKKINIRVYNRRIFTALFDRIKVNTSHDDLAGTISGDDIRNIPIVSGALNAFIPNLTTRASIINAGMIKDIDEIYCGLLSSGVVGYQDNNAAQEEVIGKIINLIEAGEKTEYFKLLVIAQAIEDNGGINGQGIKITKYFKDGSSYEFNAKVGQFDVTVKNVDGENDTVYADNILAEQKISVLVHRNPTTGKCSIISMDFVK